MTLRELLEKMKPETKIKIGAEIGTGWIFTGTVREFLNDPYADNDRLVYEAKKRAMSSVNTLSNYAKKFPTEKKWNDGEIKADRYSVAVAEWGKKLARDTMRTAAIIECLEMYKPLIDRDVIDKYPALGENAVNIQVKGADKGDKNKISVAKMKPLSAEAMSDKGATKLAAAIYGEVTDELKGAYIREWKRRERKEQPSRIVQDAIKRHENWLRRDTYGILEDPQNLISEVKRAAKMEWEEMKERKNNEKKKDIRK